MPIVEMNWFCLSSVIIPSLWEAWTKKSTNVTDRGEANNKLQRKDVAASEKTALFLAEEEWLNQGLIYFEWHWIYCPFGF